MDKCRICGCSNLKKVTLISSHPNKIKRGKEYKYFFCSECGCLQETIFPENYDEIYTKEYFLNKKSLRTWVWDKYAKYSITNKGLFGKIISLVYKPVDYSFVNLVDKKSKILDVGCGTGQFLNDLHTNGYKNLTGCDPYLAEETSINGIRLVKKEIYDLKDKKYDLITLINVFEHMEEPERVLKCLEKLVSDDGYIVILLPVINEFLWNNFGTSIWNLSPPEHLYIHTERSLKRLFVNTGFELLDWYTECSSILFSDKINMDRGKIDKNIKRSLISSIWCAVATRKNRVEIDDKKQGNQAVFILRKNR